MNRRNKVMMSGRSDEKMVFKIKSQTRKMPISEGRTRKERGTIGKTL